MATMLMPDLRRGSVVLKARRVLWRRGLYEDGNRLKAQRDDAGRSRRCGRACRDRAGWNLQYELDSASAHPREQAAERGHALPSGADRTDAQRNMESDHRRDLYPVESEHR